MHHESDAPRLRLVNTLPDRSDRGDDDRPPYQPTIAIDDIFRELIRSEIRNGRLSTWRRRRIVQYAAQLNLSAVEAGRMIEECRAEFFGDQDWNIDGLRMLASERSTSRHTMRHSVLIVLGLLLILSALA
jgi:hypothetical protein